MDLRIALLLICGACTTPASQPASVAASALGDATATDSQTSDAVQDTTPGDADAEVQTAPEGKTCSPCESDDDCLNGRICDQFPAAGSPKFWKNVCKTKAECEVDCAAAFDNQCQESGACHVVSGQCGPTSNADCAQAKACTEAGNCTFVENWQACANCPPRNSCRAMTNSDCLQSTACTVEGKCTADQGHCRIKTACGLRDWVPGLAPSSYCKGNVGCTPLPTPHCACACTICADEVCLETICDDSPGCFGADAK